MGTNKKTPAKPRLPAAQRVVLELAALQREDTVLELPCESGLLARTLRQSTVSGLRHAGACFDPESTRAMREVLPRSDLMYALPEELPWPALHFDAVLGSITPALSPAMAPLLVEILRVLKPGGQCVLAVPTLPKALRWLPNGKMAQYLSASQMKQQLIWAGFRRAACYAHSPFLLVAVGFGSEKAKFL